MFKSAKILIKKNVLIESILLIAKNAWCKNGSYKVRGCIPHNQLNNYYLKGIQKKTFTNENTLLEV